MQDKAGTAQELFAALCQDTQYAWEHPEAYRQRVAAAQQYQARLQLHERTFNAEAYHLNQAEEVGYASAEALQFVLGPEILKGALKAGSRVIGLGVGAKVAEGDKLLGQGVRKFAGNEALEHFSLPNVAVPQPPAHRRLRAAEAVKRYPQASQDEASATSQQAQGAALLIAIPHLPQLIDQSTKQSAHPFP